MWPQRYWPGRYFSGRYWPKVGDVVQVTRPVVRTTVVARLSNTATVTVPLSNTATLVVPLA